MSKSKMTVAQIAETAIARLNEHLTDSIFQIIQEDHELMTAYMTAVSDTDWGSVNRTIGRIIKDRYGLKNLGRSEAPVSTIIKSYTQFE